MANVLIASLGKSPIVVTAMVKALQEQKNILFDQVIVLYPQQQTLIEDGVDLIKTHCLCRNIIPSPLSFEDADSEDRCISFLHTLYGVLEKYQRDTVYLSLAGGRKSMSALMYLPAPFYPNIKGVYHILDKHEGTKHQNFHDLNTIVESFMEGDPKLEKIMNPPSENLSVVKIPFEYFANADDLRRIIKEKEFKSPESVPIELENIEPDALRFWKNIFSGKDVAKKEHLTIRFSQIAYHQYRELGDNQKKQFLKYFRMMTSPDFLEQKKHGTFSGKNAVFHFCKLRQTSERPFFYKKDNEVVLAQLTHKADNTYQNLSRELKIGSYIPSAEKYKPEYSLGDIQPLRILVASLGKSPMVITQAFTLLEHFENVKINKIALVYPKLNATICSGVDILKDVFEKKNVEIINRGVDMDDVNDDEKCKSFLTHLIKTIDTLNQKFPDADIRMLLSGGRKGMSALSLLAAQRSDIPNVYHTLITSPELEDRLEREGNFDALKRLKSRKERAKVLFLEDYTAFLNNNFALFKIPVIPLKTIS